MVILTILLIYLQEITSELKDKMRKITCEQPMAGFRCWHREAFFFLIVGCTGLCCDLQAFSSSGTWGFSNYDAQAVVCMGSVIAARGLSFSMACSILVP